MQAVSFEACFQKRVSRFEIDLSNSTLIQVLQSYQSHKRVNSPGYCNSYVVTSIRDIEKTYDQEIMPEDVTDIFYAAFIDYLFSKGLMYSTISMYCGAIRTALKWACKHRCRVSSTYDEFHVPNHEPFRLSLTPDEISHIAHFDVSTIKTRSQHKRTLELVRDAFVLQANLFQRYSDMRHISADNFNNGIFTCVQQKTGNKAVVDIRRYSFTPDYAFYLLKKYNFSSPYKGNINNYNRHLHFLLSKIGGSFDNDVIFEEKRGDEVVKVVRKKWQVISSHCARRSSITNAVKTAPTETEVRFCSGHTASKSDSFRRYVVDMR